MAYRETYILIPSHSLEDFPTELAEDEAAGILNAFAVAWHPALLASVEAIPLWHRADEPPETLDNTLVIIPACAESWVPGGWKARAESAGATVVSGVSERQELASRVLAPLELEQTPDAGLVADFFALGTCWLMLELLTRHMHHFSNMDEVHLQREAVSAAQAALNDDAEAARSHLKACFDVLLEARERFYPVDCYLIDLCLVIPRLADQHFDSMLRENRPVSVLMSVEDLQEAARARPEIIPPLKEAFEAGRVELLGGELHEGPSTLLPIESVLWQFRKGQQALMELVGRTPTTWGRRRYGFSTLMPLILNRSGYHAALHLALDDGIYPETERCRIQWEGCDGTIIDAAARIPLAVDSALSWLRFPQRLAESMEEDQTAALILARWPEVKSPWFEDLHRIADFAPALGRWVTFRQFFEMSDDPGRLSTFDAGEYLTPCLIQAVARREKAPVSRFVDHIARRNIFDAASWMKELARLLSGKMLSAEDPAMTELEARLEFLGPDALSSEASARNGEHDPAPLETEELNGFAARSGEELARVLLHGGGHQPGALIVNTLSFPRRVSVDLPDFAAPPAMGGPVKTVQFDGVRRQATVDLPASGYVWLAPGSADAASPSGPPTVEDGVMRNERFEVWINETTGGIARIKEYGRKPNRLSQQLAFRFPRERVIVRQDDEHAFEEKSWYSEMRMESMEVTCDGPALAEVVTVGDIVDQKDGTRLSGYRQTVRVWRGRPVVELEIELTPERMPEGDPWSNYFAARFAWHDSTAALTRSVQQGAQSFRGERIESPWYFEIASDEERTTILPHGLPFHRKTGPRMLDTILITESEDSRKFRLTIAVDSSYPMQSAADAMTPPAVISTTSGPPAAGPMGWFFHVDARNVQITRILPTLEGAVTTREVWEQHDLDTPPPGEGFALRLVETEGRARKVRLQCFRPPSSARQRDFTGQTLSNLTIEQETVLVDLSAWEVADIELRFE
ncbi:MAG: hypothetical protein KDA79_06750 [Planctomycetaceae bacterium]|nr:hypothetical protein [Planctomycetaceae bacterium]